MSSRDEQSACLAAATADYGHFPFRTASTSSKLEIKRVYKIN